MLNTELLNTELLSCELPKPGLSDALPVSDDRLRSCPRQDLFRQLDRPLRTLFLLTSMPVGGAETLLVNMIRRFHPQRIAPAVACTKEQGPLGELLANEFPVTSHWLRGKYDVSIVRRLARYLRRERFDALITVGAGDKMFWGRIAARLANVPVVCSALHSTGWPDGVGRLNRWLTPWTTAYIAVAKSHGEFLIEWEKFPESKVVVIPNGIDTDRFQPDEDARRSVREELSLGPETPLIGIVAALRPEKNHAGFVAMAALLCERFPTAHFLIIGEGPERCAIEKAIANAGLKHRIRMLGSRSDTPRLVAALDLFVLTSLNEASPVSILEALACQVPVVASRVGSVAETVIDGTNGFTVPSQDTPAFADAASLILSNPDLARELGRNGRVQVTANASLDAMVLGYETLIVSQFLNKTA